MKVFGNFDAHKIYPNELSEKKLWESGFFLCKEQNSRKCSTKKKVVYLKSLGFFPHNLACNISFYLNLLYKRTKPIIIY